MPEITITTHHQFAAESCAEVPCANEVDVRLGSQIGSPIIDPPGASAHLILGPRPACAEIQMGIESVARRSLAIIGDLTAHSIQCDWPVC